MDDQGVVTWFFLKEQVMELKDMETPEAEAIEGGRDLRGERLRERWIRCERRRARRVWEVVF